jgi:hypothetical protein
MDTEVRILRSSSTRAMVGMKPLLADVPFRFEPGNPGANVTSLQQLCDSVSDSRVEADFGTGEQSVVAAFFCPFRALAVAGSA